MMCFCAFNTKCYFLIYCLALLSLSSLDVSRIGFAFSEVH